MTDSGILDVNVARALAAEASPAWTAQFRSSWAEQIGFAEKSIRAACQHGGHKADLLPPVPAYALRAKASFERSCLPEVVEAFCGEFERRGFAVIVDHNGSDVFLSVAW